MAKYVVDEGVAQPDVRGIVRSVVEFDGSEDAAGAAIEQREIQVFLAHPAEHGGRFGLANTATTSASRTSHGDTHAWAHHTGEHCEEPHLGWRQQKPFGFVPTLDYDGVSHCCNR